MDEAVNGAELFIHHEDVRRGEPGWEPRGADETRDGALWALVRARVGCSTAAARSASPCVARPASRL